MSRSQCEPIDVRETIRSPFTRADALAAGVPASTLRTKRVRTLFRGVYVWADEAEPPLARTRAALALHPRSAFASHHSALRVHGLPDVVTNRDEHVSVFDASARRPREGISTHLAARDAPVVRRRGIRVSSAIGTFLDLAADVPLVDVVAIGDAITKRETATPDELARAAGDYTRPGPMTADTGSATCSHNSAHARP